MIIGRVVTSWAGSGTPDDPYHPALADTYSLLGWMDVTGHPVPQIPPSPNRLVITAVVTNAVAQAIAADASVRVLTSGTWNLGDDLDYVAEEDNAITDAEFNAIATWLQNHGLTLAQVQAAIGSAGNGRLKRLIVAALRAWLHNRLHG